MGGKTFRSRWVVGWGVVFGGLCTGAAILMFMAAARASQAESMTDAETKKIQAQCEEQFRNGGGSDDSRCFRTSGAGANENVKGVLGASVLGALGAVQLIGAARIGVTLTGRGIVVRNPLRTHRIAWGDIDRFRTEVGRARGMSYAFGRVDLLNGDTHRIEAIAAMPWEDKNHFQDERVITALNTELEAWRANPNRSEEDALAHVDFGDGPMRVVDMFAQADDDDREPPKPGEAGGAASTTVADTGADPTTDEGWIEGEWSDEEWVDGEWVDGKWVETEWVEGEWRDGVWVELARGTGARRPVDARTDADADADTGAGTSAGAEHGPAEDPADDPIGAPDDPIDSVPGRAKFAD